MVMDYRLWSYSRSFCRVLLCLLLVALSGCRKKISLPGIERAADSVGCQLVSHVVDDPRFVDISVPVGVSTSVVQEHSDGALIARYQTHFAIDMVIDFYHLDMERFGWHERLQMRVGGETLLLFEKPYMWAIVAMQRTGSVTYVAIYLARKQDLGS